MACKEGAMELPGITRHCLLHVVHVLNPSDIQRTLSKSGLHKIKRFCKELSQSTQLRRKDFSVPDPHLLQTIDIHKFEEGAITVGNFTQMIEQQLLKETNGDIDLDALHRLCWRYYEADKKSTIFPKWLSQECTYRLWLIFNTVHDYDLVTSISQSTVNEVVKRLTELCGYTWNKAYQYTKQKEVEFPEYTEAITDYFDQLHLETSLICEVIASLEDEVVNGVIKKGHLKKKGHKRIQRNWLKRWFVLQRTILFYYETRDAVKLKGQLVLYGRTKVQSVPDVGNMKDQFVVTCGHTGLPFQMCADDQQTKLEWILAIKKAIALARIIEGGSFAKQDSFTESITGFYLLKYVTKMPTLSRQDSELQKMKYHMIVRQFQRLPEAGREDSTRQTVTSTDSEDEPLEEYCEMQPGVLRVEDDSSDYEEDELEQDFRSGTADKYTGLPNEIPVPLRTPSRGKSSLKGGTPTSPTEKPLIVIEPRLEDTPPPVVEQPQSPLLYGDTSGNKFQQNSDINGSHIRDTKESRDRGRGPVDLESPPAASKDNRKLPFTMHKNSPPSLDTKRNLHLRQTSLPNTSSLSDKEKEKSPIPPRKPRTSSPRPVWSPGQENYPEYTLNIPPGSQVISRDAPLDTPPIPPPRFSPRQQKKFTGNVLPSLVLVIPDENPPPIPRHRRYRSASPEYVPPSSPSKIRPASTIGIPLEHGSENTT